MVYLDLNKEKAINGAFLHFKKFNIIPRIQAVNAALWIVDASREFLIQHALELPLAEGVKK